MSCHVMSCHVMCADSTERTVLFFPVMLVNGCYTAMLRYVMICNVSYCNISMLLLYRIHCASIDMSQEVLHMHA